MCRTWLRTYVCKLAAMTFMIIALASSMTNATHINALPWAGCRYTPHLAFDSYCKQYCKATQLPTQTFQIFTRQLRPGFGLLSPALADDSLCIHECMTMLDPLQGLQYQALIQVGKHRPGLEGWVDLAGSVWRAC